MVVAKDNHAVIESSTRIAFRNYPKRSRTSKLDATQLDPGSFCCDAFRDRSTSRVHASPRRLSRLMEAGDERTCGLRPGRTGVVNQVGEGRRRIEEKLERNPRKKISSSARSCLPTWLPIGGSFTFLPIVSSPKVVVRVPVPRLGPLEDDCSGRNRVCLSLRGGPWTRRDGTERND